MIFSKTTAQTPKRDKFKPKNYADEQHISKMIHPGL